MMIKLIKPDCVEATTCRIYELKEGEITLVVEHETRSLLTFVGLSEPMSVDAAITAIKNDALAKIKTSGEESDTYTLKMKNFVGYTEIEKDGLQIGLFLSGMSEKTREKFIKAFNY
nr:MAG: hypothetical protein [Bacteriophage sp.]